MKISKIINWALLFLSINCQAQTSSRDALISSKKQKVIIDNFAKELSDSYIYPEKTKLISTKLDSAFIAGYFKTSKTNADFGLQVTQFVRSIVQDNHLGLKYRDENQMGNQPGPQPRMIRREPNDRGETMPPPMAGMREPVEFKMLENNIGYLRLDLFDEQPIFYDKVDEAFEAAQNTKALIIDLRNNGGGSPRAVAYVASYLLKEKTQLSSIFIREGKNINEDKFFTEAVRGKKFMEKPVYILTGKRTFSAAEHFTYDLQALKRVKVIGLKTVGGANPGREFELGNSFFAFIPFGRSYNPITKTNWEGVGIQPDVLTEKDALEETQKSINK